MRVVRQPPFLVRLRRYLVAIGVALALVPSMADAGGDSFAAGFLPPLTPELKARLAEADLAAAAKYYERKCSQCHDGVKEGGHGKGPHLWNVMGRKAASAPGFAYSEAMKKAGLVWDYATLDYYLADTERAVPGRAMNFGGIQDDRLRASVIGYLRTLGDAPPALP